MLSTYPFYVWQHRKFHMCEMWLGHVSLLPTGNSLIVATYSSSFIEINQAESITVIPETNVQFIEKMHKLLSLLEQVAKFVWISKW